MESHTDFCRHIPFVADKWEWFENMNSAEPSPIQGIEAIDLCTPVRSIISLFAACIKGEVGSCPTHSSTSFQKDQTSKCTWLWIVFFV
jgi:hypothetical protein